MEEMEREFTAVVALDVPAAVAAMKGLRKGNTLGGVSLLELIDEGRRL